MSGVTAEKLTKTYLKIRDERAKLSAEFKEKDSTLSRQLDRVKQGLRLNQTNFKQFLEENPESKPEGLNIDSEYSIAVRKK